MNSLLGLLITFFSAFFIGRLFSLRFIGGFLAGIIGIVILIFVLSNLILFDQSIYFPYLLSLHFTNPELFTLLVILAGFFIGYKNRKA
jgi:hypothetical protein